MNILLIILLVVVFLSGLYFYTKSGYRDGLTNMSEPRCPNILVQKGINYYLYNSKIAKVPGVNPIEFANLEDYVEFIDWQRSQGIRCPVLYLQYSYDAQGNPVYKVRPSVNDLQGGLPPAGTLANNPTNINPTPNINPGVNMTPTSNQFEDYLHPTPSLLVDASHDDRPYNINSMPSRDETSYYVGKTTPLDVMDQTQENLLYSADPMNANWAGADYTQRLVDSGYYKGNNVKIYIP
jgi:hypothetical protein